MTILFFISLGAITAMLASKIFQIKVRQIDFLSRVFMRGDAMLRNWMDKALRTYALYTKIARLFLFDFLPHYVYEQAVKGKNYLVKRYQGLGEDMRGRRVLKNSGSVSFFLERLADKK